MGKTDEPRLEDWVGRTERQTDFVAATPIAALSALLDRDDPPPRRGDALPPLAHWLLFPPLARQSEIGPDGHARRGAFLPPVPLPRRMWAGSRVRFVRPLAIGEEVTRTSRIAAVERKRGRAGELVFVTVKHELHDAGGLAIDEEQDIVYREAPRADVPAPAPQAAPADAAFEREIAPDPVRLFRYSALTFNGHRIHYDHPYVTQVEGYPGLVVHGPLIATLLVDLLRRARPEARIVRFTFRAVRPLFDTHRFFVCGRPQDARTVALWARDHEGWLAMQADAEIE